MHTFDLPWLFDRHSHVSLYAALEGCPSLAGLAQAEALDLLRGLPRDRVSTVVGWHSSRLPFTPGQLEALPPAILVNFSLHGFALAGEAGRVLASDHPELLDHQGDAEWCERNLARLLVFFGQAAGLTAPKLGSFMAGLQRVGIGAAEDLLLLDEAALEVIQASPWKGRIRCWTTPALYRSLGTQARDQVAGLKLFTDGAVGAHTAALEGTFLGGGDGLLLHTGPGLERVLGELQPLGKAVAIHAIGGRAVEQTLAALEHLAACGLALPGTRLEHAQFITLEQARRAKVLGLTLSMQPNFNSDSVDYADRLGPGALEANNPFRMLLDQAGFRCGEDLVFGSDGMPHGVEYAFQWGLFPAYPGQRLTVAELVAGFGVAPEGGGHATLGVDEARGRVALLHSEA